jgi:hypothetical protein
VLRLADTIADSMEDDMYATGLQKFGASSNQEVAILSKFRLYTAA